MNMPLLSYARTLVSLPGLGIMLGLVLLMQALPGYSQPARARVDLQCEAHGAGPRIDCIVRVQRPDGTPLEGAALTVGANMPSMPMAHSVHGVAARPGGKTGDYVVSLDLEMSGVWALEIDLVTPVRERIVRVVRAQECEKTDPCQVQEARRGRQP